MLLTKVIIRDSGIRINDLRILSRLNDQPCTANCNSLHHKATGPAVCCNDSVEVVECRGEEVERRIEVVEGSVEVTEDLVRELEHGVEVVERRVRVCGGRSC